MQITPVVSLSRLAVHNNLFIVIYAIIGWFGQTRQAGRESSK